MKLFICDPDRGFIAKIAQEAHSMGVEAVSAVGVHALDRAALEEQVSSVVFGPGIPVSAAIGWTEERLSAGRHVASLLITSSLTTDLMRQALKSGVSDMLSIDVSPEQLRAAIGEILKEPERAPGATASDADRTRGRVITVFSTKGGVGKTVIATNLAVALAKMGKATVIVDLDLQFGDVAIMMRAEPAKTLLGAAQASDRLDQKMLEGYLTEHSSGLKMLLAPVRPEDAEAITAGRIGRVLDMLVSMFDYVVVDTAAALDDVVLAALDASERIIAVTQMDVASVKNTRISLQKLKQLGYDGDRVEVLLNRADSKVFLQPDEVERAIGSKIRYRLPSDQLVPRSVNKGSPLVIEAPKCAVSRVVSQTALHLIESAEVETHVA